MTDLPPSGDSSPYGDDLRTLLASHVAGYEPDRARIRARIDAGLADAGRSDSDRAGARWADDLSRPDAGRPNAHLTAWPRLRPPVRVAALAAASMVAAAAVLFAVIDTGRPVQVSTTGPASGASGPLSGNGDGAAGDNSDDPAAAPLPSVLDGGTDPTADGQPLVAGNDVPGIRVPADDPDPTASTAASDPDGVGAPAVGPGGTGGSGGATPATSTPTAVGGGAEGGPSVDNGAGGATTSTLAAEPTTRPSSITTASPTTARPTTATPVAGPAVQTGSLPQQVVLGPTGQLDWVVVGSRNDGRIVRMKAGTGRLTVSAPSGALPTGGLIPILWSGGSPEQDRTDNTRWWTANASSSSFVVQVAGADNASEVVLYAGSSTSITVTVTVSGRGVTQKTVSAGFFGTAAKITVPLSGSDRGRDVTITLGAAKGTVSLGAVTER